MGRISLFAFAILAALVALQLDSGVEAQKNRQLYVFGDSNVDTGNLEPDNPDIHSQYYPPYGITWPGKPTGRFSDGRLFTDYLASYLRVDSPVTARSLKITPGPGGLKDVSRVQEGEMMEVSEERKLNRKLRYIGDTRKNKGINFAFSGSGVFPVRSSFSLNVTTQIDIFRTAIHKGFANPQDFPHSIALVVINGNDYSNYIRLHPNMEGAEEFIPKVVKGIGNAVEELSSLSFKNIAIANIGPYGCLPLFTIFYNYTHCDDKINALVGVHNSLLEYQISSLRQKLPNSNIIKLDLHHAIDKILKDGMFIAQLTPCCKANHPEQYCGDVDEDNNPLYTVCSNIDEHFFWDGHHPTEVGWKAISKISFASLQDNFNN